MLKQLRDTGTCPTFSQTVDYRDDNDTATFGLSKNAVRGILVIWSVLTACLTSIYVLFSSRFPMDFKYIVLVWVLSSATTAFNFYFISRLVQNRQI